MVKAKWRQYEAQLKARLLYMKQRDLIDVSIAVKDQTLEEVLQREFESVTDSIDHIDRMIIQIEVYTPPRNTCDTRIPQKEQSQMEYFRSIK